MELPDGQDANAARFLQVLDANAFQLEGGKHAGIFAVLSRVNHSCAPNAIRVEVGGRMRLVAMRPIAAGDEVCISYLKADQLLEPAAMRREGSCSQRRLATKHV